MEWVYPTRLKKGMKIAFTAPASATEEGLEALAELWESLDYRTMFGSSCSKRGLFGGTPEEQACEFNQLMTEADCDAVIALRGGYGSVRYLEQLDYDGIRQAHKPFVGYSDCTALHCAIHRYSRLATYHGPMGWDQLQPDRETDIRHLVELLEGRTTVIEPLPAPPRGMIGTDMGFGRLIGGNMTILSTLGGTPYAPDEELWREAILFLEDIGEPPYKLDRMLQQLRHQGVLKLVKGVALGSFTNCEDDETEGTSSPGTSSPETFSSETSRTYDLGARILEYLPEESFICYLPAGHGTPHWAIPLGSEVAFRAVSNTVVCMPYYHYEE